MKVGQRMRNLQLSKIDSGWNGRIGNIYLSWQSACSMGFIRPKYPLFQSKWRRFVELVITAELKKSMLYAGSYWMNDDLFLVVHLPEGRLNVMEGWLLELAVKLQSEWEQRFVELELEGDTTVAKLHAGISIVEQDSPDHEDDRIYEAAKRAIIHGQLEDALIHSMKHRALEQLITMQSIVAAYQPIISLHNGGRGLFGYEALTRFKANQWFAGPQQLFSFAEEEGMVYSLDRLAREKAIDGCGELQLQEKQKLFINVPAQIMDDPDFSPGRTLNLLEQHHLSPQNIVFEITERCSIEDFDAVKKVLKHYRSQGYQIAIDDVGAGYSSLQSIIELRPDYIKVDRSIMDHIDEDEVKEHILHTLVQLAYKLGIRIIAEGIEREEELNKAREMGVHYAQGYLLGRPSSKSL